MPLPRVRFTVRWMMVAVVIVAVISAVLARAARFRELAHYHGTKVAFVSPPSPLVTKTLYHLKMVEKYLFHARYPFLPVAPDPPEPE